MLTLTFGLLRPFTTTLGREKTLGDYCLHVQCCWRIVKADQIVVASDDWRYPADEEMEWGSFDPETMDSRLKSRMTAWRESYLGYPVCAKGVQADCFGGFELPFECGSRLQAFPDSSLTGRYSELWRIFKPHQDGPHFVVLGGSECDT